jgi:hypothetical protein
MVIRARQKNPSRNGKHPNRTAWLELIPQIHQPDLRGLNESVKSKNTAEQIAHLSSRA